MNDKTTDTIFKQIIDGKIPAKIVYEDELCLAFHDIAPNAKVHILVIPKTTELPTLNAAQDKDKHLLGHMLLVAKQIAQDCGIDQSGYRLICNINQDAGQIVFHLHFHIIGGEKLGPLN